MHILSSRTLGVYYLVKNDSFRGHFSRCFVGLKSVLTGEPSFVLILLCANIIKENNIYPEAI